MKVFLSVVIGALACTVAIAQTEQSDDHAWTAFIEWVKSPAAPDNPPEMMKAYQAKLASSGLSDKEVRAQIGIIQKYAGRPGSPFTAIIFDKMYASATPPFNPEPSAFLTRAIQGLNPGKALDVAMGQGRNAVFLARQGWEVTGYDVSEVGLATAGESAAKAGVTIHTARKTHQDFDFGTEQWDLIAMVFPGASMDDEPLLKRIRASLKPGGMVVVEQFNAPPVEGAKGPANALFKTFQDFRVVRYEDVVDRSDWGKTNARIGRIAAIKE